MSRRPNKLEDSSTERVRCMVASVARLLLASALVHSLATGAFSQHSLVLLDDAKAVVTRTDVYSDKPCVLASSQAGSVWAAVDPVIVVTRKDGGETRKEVRSGGYGIVGSGEVLEFRATAALPSRLVFVMPKMPHQELTVGDFSLNRSLEDASDRNATLLIALTDCRFSDTRNLGDESEWVPSKARVVVMRSGSVKWIGPGIHHFKNLGSTPTRLVSVEW
jgi:hypothetical protein